MRTIIIMLTMLMPSIKKENKPTQFKAIESEFPLIWKANIGNGSFRTNIANTNNELIIGSNGKYFMDYDLYDSKSGVYKLNRINGKVVKKFGNECLGDMDVNGVMIYKNRLYFGNDNEEFLCTNLNGEIIWRNLTSGDIEHEPTLLKIKGKDIIVYASEEGEVRAIEPISGKTIWEYYTPNFSGYKPGDNRAIFKVKAYFSNTVSFYEKPEVADINQDGEPDLIYLTYDNKVYAINGVNGQLLWLYNSQTNLAVNIATSGPTSNPVFSILEDYYYYGNNTETNLITLNRNGEIIEKRKIKNSCYELGLNHFKTKQGEIILNTSDSLLFIKNGKVTNSMYHAIYYEREKKSEWEPAHVRRTIGQPIFCLTQFSFNKHPNCILILNQFDYAYSDNAYVEIIDIDNKEVIKRFALPSTAEMPPQILDINKDGFLDLIVSCKDGYLYCYNMKTSASK